MQFPCYIVSTVDCNCDTIKYRVVVCYDEDNNQEAIIDAVNLLPFIGKVTEMLNAHRIEEDNKNKEKSE